MTHKFHFTTEVIEGKSRWVGTCEDYPDVIAIDDTFKEALDMLDDVVTTLDEWHDSRSN